MLILLLLPTNQPERPDLYGGPFLARFRVVTRNKREQRPKTITYLLIVSICNLLCTIPSSIVYGVRSLVLSHVGSLVSMKTALEWGLLTVFPFVSQSVRTAFHFTLLARDLLLLLQAPRYSIDHTRERGRFPLVIILLIILSCVRGCSLRQLGGGD